ncbi:MAG: SDR family oxidoreductase [Burkholderiaceae bacterium]|nr:SDR family oxidoreductase [Burkholderiaceae bacterium]
MDERIFRLDGRVAAVTGGAGGLGSAICQLFANVGAQVACIDIDLSAAEEQAETIRKNGGKAIGVQCDVASEASTVTAAATIADRLGHATVLVNCAAVLDRSGTILDIDLAEWDKVLRTDVTGAYLMSRAILPGMIEAGGGSIVHIASMHAHVTKAGRVSYATAKGALLMLAKTMAADHAAQGVRVNTLSPGAIRTRRTEFRYGSMTQEMRREHAARYLLNRSAMPDEIASATLFLASQASSYMTAADLLVDGGYSAI